jgi:hypothetical protein
MQSFKADTDHFLIRLIHSVNLEFDRKWEAKTGSVGLLQGNTGVILFLNELNTFNHEIEVSFLIKKLSRRIKDEWNQGLRQKTFIRGSSGILFAQRYLDATKSDIELLSYTESDIAKLIHWAAIYFSSNNIDFLHGGSGLTHSVFCFDSISLENENKLISALLSTVIKTKHGHSWRSLDQLQTESNLEFNIGMAHGVLPIINLLSSFTSHKASELLNPLLNDVFFRFKQICNKLISENSGYSFSCRSHYLSWCNSPICTALILLRIFDKKEMKFEYIEVETLTLVYLDFVDNLYIDVNDTCLCHGVTGVIIILEELFEITRNKKIYMHLLKWKDLGINLLLQESLDDINLEAEGILTGIYGKALGLMHLTEPTDLLKDVLNLRAYKKM